MDFFASPVMLEALLPALLIAMISAAMSVMVVAHRLSFLTVGVSHATLAGLGLAVFFALPLLPTATMAAVTVALLLAVMPRRSGIGEDVGTGLLFAGAMALGVLLISSADKYDVDLFGMLFGNILTASQDDIRWLWLTAAVVCAGMLFAARAWWMIAFDAATASAGGIPVKLYRSLLYAVVALTVIMCVKLAGIVLTTGLLVLPAACAWFWGRSPVVLWLLSSVFALAGTLAGLMISYHHDLPSGASVVITLCMIFVLSWSVAWLKQRAL